MTQVIYVTADTTEQDILNCEDPVLLAEGSIVPYADHLATKYGIKALYVNPIYSELPYSRATFAPRIVMTNDEKVKAVFEKYAMVVPFPLTKAYPNKEVEATLKELINTEVI
jgi:hypothetical protein